MIEMPCPHCSRKLEIDEGFRGGICRCFHCGALLTVPKRSEGDPPGEQPRPEAPAPVKRGEPRPGPELSPREDPKPRETEATAESSAPPPPESRRMAVRIATVVVMCVLMLALIGGVIWGMVSLLSGPEPVGQDPGAVHADVFVIDRNPFLTTEPSFMSLPMAATTAIMVDGSAAMRQSLGQVKQAVAHSADTLGEHRVQIVFWREEGPLSYPEEPTPAARIDPESLRERLDEVVASGGISAAPAFAETLEGQPDLIILVARLAPEPDELETIGEQVRESGVRLVAVLIDNSDDTLAEIAERSGGRLIELPARRLQRWHEEYLARQGP